MLDQLERVEKRYQELTQQIATPEVMSDPKQLQIVAQERAGIEGLVTKYRQYKVISKTLEDTRAMLGGEQDNDMVALVKQEMGSLESQLDHLFEALKLALRSAGLSWFLWVHCRTGSGLDRPRQRERAGSHKYRSLCRPSIVG